MIVNGERNKTPFITNIRLELSVKHVEVKDPLKSKQNMYHSRFRIDICVTRKLTKLIN